MISVDVGGSSKRSFVYDFGKVSAIDQDMVDLGARFTFRGLQVCFRIFQRATQVLQIPIPLAAVKFISLRQLTLVAE